MKDSRGGDGRFLFVGGLLCLDFVNTEVMAGDRRTDLLESFDSLVDWLQAAAVLRPAEADAFREQWGGTAEGERVLEDAGALRTALRCLVERAEAGKAVESTSVAAINAALRDPVRTCQVRGADGRFEEEEAWAFRKPAHLLAPVAYSASELICARDLSLVRTCRNEHCIICFYDATRNHARVWCSMSLCGNRAKVAAHYRRRHRRH